jgi:Ni/Co efflux regulator RcnB
LVGLPAVDTGCCNLCRQSAKSSPREEITMREFLTVIALVTAAAAIALPAQAAGTAAEPAKPRSAQQDKDKIAACNERAGDRKGDERKAFLQRCFSAKTAGTSTTQQEKMKSCNVEAKGKTGADRKKFMSECLRAG